MFQVLLDDKLTGADLTAVQAQIVAAEILERFVLRPGPKVGTAKAKVVSPALNSIA